MGIMIGFPKGILYSKNGMVAEDEERSSFPHNLPEISCRC